MSDADKKKTLEAQIEQLQKENAALAKDATRAESKAREAELAAARLRDAARRTPEENSNAKARTAPVVAEDIVDDEIRGMLKAAKQIAPDFEDSPSRRRPLASKAQDCLIALRELNVGFIGHGVSLFVNKTPKQLPDGQITKGDLYVGDKGCHPRQVAEVLAARLEVAELVELVAKLTAALEYEATPEAA